MWDSCLVLPALGLTAAQPLLLWAFKEWTSMCKLFLSASRWKKMAFSKEQETASFSFPLLKLCASYSSICASWNYKKLYPLATEVIANNIKYIEHNSIFVFMKHLLLLQNSLSCLELPFLGQVFAMRLVNPLSVIQPCVRGAVWVPAALFLTQPANAPGKAMEAGQSAWVPITKERDLTGVPGSRNWLLWPIGEWVSGWENMLSLLF